ncbi:MAG: hypothetical protein N3G22_04850, partial [Candidatus Micrarchaeota archaeon]|nr:hypothetical protein [Candidatus Micrarchaeota archaeon]
SYPKTFTYNVTPAGSYYQESSSQFPWAYPPGIRRFRDFYGFDLGGSRIEGVESFSMSFEAVDDISNWMRVNYANFVYSQLNKVKGRVRSELDLLFKDKLDGNFIAVLEDQKNAALRAFVYRKGESGQIGQWFDAGFIWRDGKPVENSGFTGVLDLEKIKAATSYANRGKNDVFYAVVSLPETGNLTGMASKDYGGKREYIGAVDVAKDVAVQVGYFTLDAGSHYRGTGQVKGVVGGIITKDWRGKAYFGTTDRKKLGKEHWDVFGISGTIMENTYFSWTMRLDKNISNSNFEFSHIQSIGEDVRLSTAFRLVNVRDKKPVGSGTISIESGDFAFRFGYDKISYGDYGRVVSDFLGRFRMVRTMRDLLVSTEDFLNRSLLSEISEPEMQAEIKFSKNNVVRLSKITNEKLGLSFTSSDNRTVAFTLDNLDDLNNLDDDLKFKEKCKEYMKNAGITYSDGKLHFQATSKQMTMGGSLQELLGKPIKFDASTELPFSNAAWRIATGYPIYDGIEVGPFVGNMPIFFTDNGLRIEKRKEPFFGANFSADLSGSQSEGISIDQVSANLSYHSKAKVLTYGFRAILNFGSKDGSYGNAGLFSQWAHGFGKIKDSSGWSNTCTYGLSIRYYPALP